MPAPQIVREVYTAHVRNFGEPDQSVKYDSAKNPAVGPPRIDVLIWLPNAKCNVTTFATMGMCAFPIEGAAYRAELHFAIRHNLNADELKQSTLFLANLAMFPFINHTRIDWWHRLPTGRIPLFPSARAILLHPPFAENAWDSVKTSEGMVRLFNVAPLIKEEAKMKIDDLLQVWADQNIDVLLPR